MSPIGNQISVNLTCFYIKESLSMNELYSMGKSILFDSSVYK